MSASTMPEAAPSPSVLEEIDNECMKIHVLRTALELGTIPAVARGHHAVESIASATGSSPDGIRVLLDALCAMGLMHRSEAGYELTPVAAAYLDPASPACCGPAYLRDLQSWDHFTETVRTGRVQADYSSPGEADRIWASYAAQRLGSWPNELAAYRQRWEALGVTRSTLPGVRVLDVGCGSALPTLVLALDDPQATVEGIDRGSVVAVAGLLAHAMGVSTQTSFLAGDVTTLAALEGPFDLVFFGDVFHFLGPDEIQACLGHARRLLEPTGRVVIHEVFATPDRYEDEFPHLARAWLYNVAPQGRLYSEAEFLVFLEGAGFGPGRRPESTWWLEATVADSSGPRS